MAFRIFGASAARFLRTTALPAPATAATGETFAAWKVLMAAAAASSSVVMRSSLHDRIDNTVAETTLRGETKGDNNDNDGVNASSAAPYLLRQWKAFLPLAAATTACEAAPENDPDLDPDSERQVEAVLKSRITSREELDKRREQRNKLLLENNQSGTGTGTGNKKNIDEQQTLIRRRMTSVGRFSLVSETAQNPSVPVLIMAMTGKPLFAEDFERLYRQRRIAEKYPRFGARLNDEKTHFVFDTSAPADGGGTENNSDATRKRNVRDAMYPTIPVAELKDRINDASLYEPLDLNSRLWEVWTATGGAIGQSGAIATLDDGDGDGDGDGDDDDDTQTRQSTARGDQKEVESLLLFRAHHCMADGVSLGALFSDLTDEGPDIRAKIQSQIKIYKKKKKGTPWWKKLLFALYYWLLGSMKALLYQAYLFTASSYDRFHHDDPWMILKSIYDEKRQTNKSGPQQLVPPRSISWATIAPVEEVKRVAQFYSKVNREQTGQKSKVTINDVFCSCASAAIVKQLEYHRVVNPKLSSSGQRLSLPSMNLIIPVHLQGGILLPGQELGNKIGAMVSRIPGEQISKKAIDVNDRAVLAEERLIKVHSVLNARKQTPVAALSYMMAGVMGYLSPSSESKNDATNSTGYSVGSSPSSWTPWIFRKAHANASVVVTNVRGPESAMHLDGRPVRAFLGFLPLPGGVPVGMVVCSYGNKMILTVTAEEYAVPNADQFLGWVRDEYETLKRRADEAENKK